MPHARAQHASAARWRRRCQAMGKGRLVQVWGPWGPQGRAPLKIKVDFERDFKLAFHNLLARPKQSSCFQGVIRVTCDRNMSDYKIAIPCECNIILGSC